MIAKDLAHSTTVGWGCATALVLVTLFDIADSDQPFLSVVGFRFHSKLCCVGSTDFQLDVAKKCCIDGHPDLVGSLSKD